MSSVNDDIVISCIRTIVVKSCLTFGTLLKFSGERLLDLLGLVFNLLACCTVVRAYPTIAVICRYCTNDDKKKWFKWVWRGIGLLQIFIFILDIPIMIMFLVQTVCFWRLALLIKHKNDKHRSWYEKYDFQEYGFIGWRIRVDVFNSFIGLLTDFFVIPFVIVIFCSWRSKITYDLLVEERKDFKRKLIIIQQFFLVLLDLIVIVMFFVQLLSWRVGVVIGIVNRAVNDITLDDTASIEWDFRRRIFHNFLRLFMDILMLPFIILLLFSWRAPILFKKFRTFNTKLCEGQVTRWKAEEALRGGIMTHFGRYCVDVLTLVPLALCLCSWRLPIVLLKFQRFCKSGKKRRDEYKLRYSIFFHAGQVIIDVLSIPPMLITIFSWRLVFFVHFFPLDDKKSTARKFKKVRLQFWWETLHFFMDIPVIIAFLFCVCLSWCFPWRLLQIFDAFTEQKKNYPWATYRFQGEMRWVILYTVGFLIIDLFSSIFCLVVMVTLWRVPFLIYDIQKLRKRTGITTKSFKYHQSIIKQFAMIFVDLVMFIFLLVIFGTLWRIKPMVRKIRKHSKREVPGEDDDDDEDNDNESLVVHPGPGSKRETVIDDVPGAGRSVVNDPEPGVGHPAEPGPVEELDVEGEGEGVQEPLFIYQVRGSKIRKAICINIVGLLLDVPAFILLVINCLFIYQIPFILRRFLECGDFYQEFFLIMVDETNHLLQDLFFFMIFLILVIVRPLAVWVNILEDKDHLKAKKAEEYLVTLRHVVKKRTKMTDSLESALSVFVKYRALYTTRPNAVLKRFIEENQPYTEEIKSIRDKLLDRELDDRLIYLVANIYFYESKLPYLYFKWYEIENAYCNKPCFAAREHNYGNLTTAIKQVDDKLDELYSEVRDYQVTKVPLWADKSGFLLRTRKQNQQVVIHTIISGYFGTIALCLFNSLFIYRVPVMVRNMLRVSYCRFRVRDAALDQTFEYGKDLLAVFKALIVILSVYRCPHLLSDLAHDLLSKRSVTAARKTIDRYPVDILDDLKELVMLILSWDTVVFLFASILFIICIPLSVILNTIQATKLSSIVFVFLFSLPIYFIIMAGPFAIVHHVAEKMMEDVRQAQNIPVYIGVYIGFVALVMTAFVVVKTKDKDHGSKKVTTIDYIRFNWFNAQVVFGEVLEFVQLLSLLFMVKGLSFPYAEQFRTVAEYILLDFYDYKVRFSVGVALFVIWLVLSTVPSLLEGVTKKVAPGYFSQHHFVWRSFLSFFGTTLFIFIPEMNVSMLSCDYTDCAIPEICPSLADDPEIACWTGIHVPMASISFFIMIWYVLTSLLYCMQYTDVTNKEIDLNFSPPYSAMLNICKLVLVAVIGLFMEERVPLVSVMIGAMVLMILVSLLFPFITGMEVSNAKALLIWRIQGFFTIMVISLGVLAFEIVGSNTTLAEWSDGSFIFGDTKFIDFVIPVAALALILIGAIISTILSFYFSKETEQERARAEFKDLVRNLIASETERGFKFIPHWHKIRRPYLKMLSSARAADKKDKWFETPENQYVQADAGPPPQYDECLLNLPPPPSYDDVVDGATPTAPAGESSSVGDAGNDSSAPPVDEFFLPTPKMYLTPVGAYQQYDATCLLKDISNPMVHPYGMFKDLYKTGWILDETVPGVREKQLSDTQCTGVELLRLLEEHISYRSFSYEFIVNLEEWRNKVQHSTWMGLRDAAMELNDNLTSTFHKPRVIVEASYTDILPPLSDHTHLPPYVPLSDVTELKLKLHKRGITKLMSLLPEPWLSIFQKIIPENEPLLYKVSLGSEDESNLFNIQVEMFKEVEIIIKGIAEDGFKAAIGAVIVLSNPIVISRIRKWNNRINFGEPFPYGKKGMISLNITSCSTKKKNGVYSLVAAGKSVKLSKVLASLAQLEWRFRD